MIEEIAVLGRGDDSLAIGDGSFLALAGDRCIVGPTDRDGEALVFPHCRGAPEKFGREGQGPGELRSYRATSGWRGDSVLILGYGRTWVLGGPRGQGRTGTFENAQGMRIQALPHDGVILLNEERADGPRFSLVDVDDGSTRGIGSGTMTAADRSARAAIPGAARERGRFWAGDAFYRHRLTLWTLDGQEVRTIERTPPWFAPYDSIALAKFWEASAAAARPLPGLRGLRETADGTLWGVFAVAAADWRAEAAAPVQPRSRDSEVRARSASRLAHYDGVIEALDGATGELLMSVRTNDLWAGIVNDTLFYSRREGPDGITQLALFRVRLKR